MSKQKFKYLIDEAQLDSFSKSKKWETQIRTLIILIVYTICAIIVTQTEFKIITVILCPFMGFILAGFLNAAHDCIHCTHLSSKKANRIMGILWCLPILTNFTIYRYQHLTHHRYTKIDGDTESHAEFKSLKLYLYSLIGVGFWHRVFSTSINAFKGKFLPTINNKQRQKDVLFDNIMLVCWLSIIIFLTFIYPKGILLSYWIPLLFYAPAVLLTSLPEHYQCSNVSDLRENTRSTTSNCIVRFFLWNGNYHAEHHAYPGIPTSCLHKLHNKLPKHHFKNESSYFFFHWKLLSYLTKHRSLNLE